MSRRIRDTVLVKGEWVSSNYWKGEPVEETRQQYVNVRIQEFQRLDWHDGSFQQLLGALREYGRLYDEGHRLRDDLIHDGRIAVRGAA